MSGSTLNTDELDALLLVSGILHANPETRSLSHTLLGIVKRQRALGTVPTVSAQQVADRVGDPELAKKFAQQVNMGEQLPNDDDYRRAPMLPGLIAFRVWSGDDTNVFVAERTHPPYLAEEGYMVTWKTGKRAAYKPEWVAMQLRLGRWRPTHDPITVGGAT